MLVSSTTWRAALALKVKFTSRARRGASTICQRPYMSSEAGLARSSRAASRPSMTNEDVPLCAIVAAPASRHQDESPSAIASIVSAGVVHRRPSHGAEKFTNTVTAGSRSSIHGSKSGRRSSGVTGKLNHVVRRRAAWNSGADRRARHEGRAVRCCRSRRLLRPFRRFPPCNRPKLGCKPSRPAPLPASILHRPTLSDESSGA